MALVPKKPQPAKPKLGTPQLGTAQTGKPRAKKAEPGPAKPGTTKPGLAKLSLAKPFLAKPALKQRGRAKQAPARPALTKADRPARVQAEPVRRTAPRSSSRDLAPERIAAILKGLDEAYPHAECALNHRSPWELLVATILSAQCTDVRVNMVTPALFKRYPTPAAMAKAEIPELIELIRSTGFFNNKAKSIKGAAQAIVERFGGAVPETLDELITVPGAARKTANVVLGVSFGKAEGVVVDTHVFRIAHRLSLAKGDTPQAVEQELMRVLPQEKWIDFSHQIIHHGRQVCVARKPRCKDCNLEPLCHSRDKTWHS